MPHCTRALQRWGLLFEQLIQLPRNNRFFSNLRRLKPFAETFPLGFASIEVLDVFDLDVLNRQVRNSQSKVADLRPFS